MPSGQTETLKNASNNTVATTSLSYTYDVLGNIETVSEGGVQRQKYYYDSLNQLIREDNLNKTIWTVLCKNSTGLWNIQNILLSKTIYFLGTRDCQKFGRTMVKMGEIIMKKSVWFLVKKVLIVIMTIVIIAVIYFGLGIVNMNSMQEAEAVFIYEKNNVRQKMSDKELEILKTLFDGKIMYRDNPSCGFREDVSVIFDREQTFCIACDNCPIVYWKNKNRYITLSEDEKNQLRDMLKPYGFVFPCL